MLSELPTAYPKIRGLVWFNREAEGEPMDWSIETSSSATKAFATGIQNPAYAGSQFASLAAGTIQPPAERRRERRTREIANAVCQGDRQTSSNSPRALNRIATRPMAGCARNPTDTTSPPSLLRRGARCCSPAASLPAAYGVAGARSRRPQDRQSPARAASPVPTAAAKRIPASRPGG